MDLYNATLLQHYYVSLWPLIPEPTQDTPAYFPILKLKLKNLYWFNFFGTPQDFRKDRRNHNLSRSRSWHFSFWKSRNLSVQKLKLKLWLCEVKRKTWAKQDDTNWCAAVTVMWHADISCDMSQHETHVTRVKSGRTLSSDAHYTSSNM